MFEIIFSTAIWRGKYILKFDFGTISVFELEVFGMEMYLITALFGALLLIIKN